MKKKVATEEVVFVPFQTGHGVYLTEVRNGKAVATHGPLQENTGFVVSLPKAVQETVKDKNLTAKRLKKASAKQERRIAEDIGGRAQPASGALPGAKGDVIKLGKLRIEAKFTYAESYRLTAQVLDKIEGETRYGEIPVVVVDFKEKGTNKLKRSVAVVPYEDWVKMCQEES